MPKTKVNFRKLNPLLPLSLLVAIMVLLACNDMSVSNSLLHASSPYLKQHADNPVNWQEWNDEALAKAKKENKPLLISIGYASCHWCHVMEKESFMDTAVARLMNENFMNIKVDREERPDIDNIYTTACQVLSGSAGWPLHAFALPDGKPFFAGTYYSKKSWMDLLKQVALAYKEKNNLVVKQANALTKGIAEEEIVFAKNHGPETNISKNGYQNLFDSVYSKLDLQNGGFKGAPKFPLPSHLEFLMQHHYLTGNPNALLAATNTLTKMALGGIYDQAGGGFARYATDTAWRLPHFEKMLCDNAQLISVYAHAFQLTQNVFFKNIMEETITFIERDLTAGNGAFYSSLNAVTNDGEGTFYSWTFDEFGKNVGAENAKLLHGFYNLAYNGNWKNGKNILYASATPAQFAAQNNLPASQFIATLVSSKKSLLAQRNKRMKPVADKKILAGWNALMLKAYADAYATTGNNAYLEKTLLLAAFFEKKMIQTNGSLPRNYTTSANSLPAFLDDYAYTSEAFIKLYGVTFNKHFLNVAKKLTQYVNTNFQNNSTSLFYYTADHAQSLVVKKMEVTDGVLPSSNAIMARVLYQLSVYFEDSTYNDRSKKMLQAVSQKMTAMPQYYSLWCGLAGMFTFGNYEVAIMGKEAAEANSVMQKNYLPTTIFLGEEDEENLPLLQGKLLQNATMIYVCTNKVCRLPVADAHKALDQIKNLK